MPDPVLERRMLFYNHKLFAWRCSLVNSKGFARVPTKSLAVQFSRRCELS